MKENKGFTIVELLVVIVLLGVVAAIGFGGFVSVLRGNNKATAINEVKQDGERTLEIMERTIRNASGISSVCDGGTKTAVLSLVDQDGKSVEFNLQKTVAGTSDGDGVAMTVTQGTTATTNYLTTYSYTDSPAINSYFLCTSYANKPSAVVIKLRLKSKADIASQENFISVDFDTTVGLRNY